MLSVNVILGYNLIYCKLCPFDYKKMYTSLSNPCMFPSSVSLSPFLLGFYR